MSVIRKDVFVLFVLFMILWLIFNERVTWEIVIFGAAVSLLMDLFCRVILGRPGKKSASTHLRLFIGGVRYRYYLLILGAFVPFGVIALCDLLRRAVFTRHQAAWTAARICAYAAILLLTGNCLYFIGKPRSYYPQEQFAAYMEPGSILLNYGFLDGGFFLVSGTELPDSRYFCKVNIYREQLPEMYEEQERIIDECAADYAVIRKEDGESWDERYDYAPFYENYVKIAEARESYDGYCYALYRLRTRANT